MLYSLSIKHSVLQNTEPRIIFGILKIAYLSLHNRKFIVNMSVVEIMVILKGPAYVGLGPKPFP